MLATSTTFQNEVFLYKGCLIRMIVNPTSIPLKIETLTYNEPLIIATKRPLPLYIQYKLERITHSRCLFLDSSLTDTNFFDLFANVKP